MQYAEVWYPTVYPGVDLVYYGNDGKLEYDFAVAPGANPGRIKFSLTSEPRSLVRIDNAGDLVAGRGQDEIRFHKPLLYQGESCSREKPNHGGGEPGCTVVDGAGFRIERGVRGGAIVSFKIPAYDHSQPLIIDPAVSFSTYLGGGFGDGATGMALDSAGNIYLYGDTSSSDFPVTPGAYQTHLASPPNVGSSDTFVTKLTPDGSQIIWSTYLGGTNDDTPRGMAVDSAGNVYVTGQTYSLDFPLSHPFQSQLKVAGGGFVSKLSADGTTLLYSTYLEGSSQGMGSAIAVDANDEAVVSGTTFSRDFPLVNAFQPAPGDTQFYGDAYVTKFSADGTSLIFSTYLGGDSADSGTDVALDPSGNIYVTGATTSTNLPTSPTAYQKTCPSVGTLCLFVSKFDPAGQSLYSTYVVGGQASAIAVNSTGNAFVTGRASEDLATTPGAFQTVIGNPGIFDSDAFVTELDTAGSSLVYSTFIGGDRTDWGWAIAVDSSNNAYVTGQTDSTTFPLQSPLQTNIEQDPLIFVSELNGSGSSLIFSTYWGGSPGFGDQQGNAIAVDSVGNIVVAGFATVPDFPVVNPIQAELKGPGDAVVFKIEFTPDFTLAASPASVTVSAGQSATYSLTLTPLNAFNQQISIFCSGAPAGSTCTVSPSTVTPDGVNSSPATVIVKTAAPSGNVVALGSIFVPLLASFFGLAGLCLAAHSVTATRERGRGIAVPIGMILISSLLISCGGGSNGGGGLGTPPGTYTINVKANSGTLNRELKLRLVVK